MIPVCEKASAPRPLRNTGLSVTMPASGGSTWTATAQSVVPSPSKSAIPRTVPLQVSGPKVVNPPAAPPAPAVPS